MKKKFITYLLGNFGTKLLSFILVPIYTSFLLPGEYGTYDYWITMTSLCVGVISLQLSQGTYTQLLKFRQNESNCSNIITSSIHILIIEIIVVFLVMIILLLLNFQYTFYVVSLIILMILYDFFNQGIARGLEKNELMVISSLLLSFFMLTSTVILLYIKQDKGVNIEILFIGQLIGLTISTLYTCFSLFRHKIFSNFTFKLMSKQYYLMLLLFCLPLIPNTVSWWIMNVSDRIIIVNYLGESYNGTYAIANKFPSLLFMINSIVTMVWQDQAIITYQDKNKGLYYTEQLKKYVVVQFIALVLFTILFRILAPFLLHNEFIGATKYVPLLGLSALFSGIASFYGTFYLSSGQTKGAFVTSVFGAIINILVNLLFIKSFGLYAAIFSTIVSFISITFIRIKKFKNELKLEYPFKYTIFGITIFTLTYIILYL